MSNAVGTLRNLATDPDRWGQRPAGRFRLRALPDIPRYVVFQTDMSVWAVPFCALLRCFIS